MSKEAVLVQNYLQNECSDFWHVKEDNGIIKCYFIDKFRFSVFKEDDTWYITGEDVPLNVFYNLAIVLGENM